jgi:hypothetical protein
MKTVKLWIALTVATLFVACSQSGTPSPTQAALDAAVAAHVATPSGQPMCGDDVCPDPGAVQNPNVKAQLDARKPEQVAAAACRGTDGIWHCGDRSNKNGQVAMPLMASGNASAAQCGPACTVGTWWFDPANTTGCASDSNSGTSATCSGAGIGPLATFSQFILRVGSTSPQYPAGQGVSITQMSAQAANTDFIFFEPRMASTTTSQSAAILTVTPLAVGAPQAITRNTAKTRGAPGTLLTLVNPTGVAANQLVVNTSSATPSQALVDSVGATTVMQQPQTIASVTATNVVPSPVEDDTWATGNTVQLYALQNSNLVTWRPRGGNLTSGVAPTAGFVFYANIADTSGSGASAFFHSNSAASNSLVNSVVTSRLEMSTDGGRGQGGLYTTGCSVLTSTLVGTVGNIGVFGGALTAVTVGGGFSTFTNDVILHGTSIAQSGTMGLGNVYCDGTLAVGHSGTGGGATAAMTAGGFVWGSYALQVFPNCAYVNLGGSTFVLKALLTSGSITINGVGTASQYTSGTGVWVGGVAITPAALDGAPGNGLLDPISGARICCQAGST